MSANFTLYRRGEVAFKLESRIQGHIRKITQATFKEEIMANDTIEITLVSTERLDFKLRDFIFYNGRLYFLNRLPESSIDASKRYTYKMSFEGAMYDLGRVAFILPDAFGYDYYGMLSEFVRIVVDNMNRVNMWIEWSHQYGTTKARCTTIRSYNNELYYGWRDGLGTSTPVNYVFTLGIPSVGDPCRRPDGTVIQNTEVVGIHKWSLDFPETTENPSTYPVPTPHIPEDVVVSTWAAAEYEDVTPAINALTIEASYQEERSDGIYTYEYTRFSEIFYDEMHFPSTQPTSVDDVETYRQRYTWQRRFRLLKDGFGQPQEVLRTSFEGQVGYRLVTRRAQVTTEYTIDPILPPSGQTTGNDEPTESLLLSYDQHSCLAVMQDLVAKWTDWEWHIFNEDYNFVNGEILVCGTIRLRKKDTDALDGVVHAMGFGRSGGLSLIKRRYSDNSNIPSRIYFYGGSQNLPEYYRNTRLCLPGKDKNGSYIDFSELSGTVFPLGLENTLCEEVRTLDEIYPANKPFEIKSSWFIEGILHETNQSSGVTRTYLEILIPVDEFFDINGKWSNYEWPNPDRGLSPDNAQDRAEYPDFCEWLTLMQLEDTWDGVEEGRRNRERYITYYTGRSKYMIQGESPRFVFQTGALAGYALSIHKFYELNGYYHVWLNVVEEDNEETNDYYTPNAEICCYYGDKFIIDNINMPAAYTYYNDGSESDFSAENELWKAATTIMNDIVDKIDYDVEVSRDYVVRHNDVFRIFDTLAFNDPLTELLQRLRVVSVELDLVDGYDYKLTVTNRRIVSPTSGIIHVINMQSTAVER